MLNKILASAIALIIADKTVLADDHAEPAVMEGSDAPTAVTTAAGEDEGIEPASENSASGQDAGFRQFLDTFPIPQACLIESFSIGEAEDGGLVFDYKEEVTELLRGTHEPSEFNVCTNPNNGAMISIQIIYESDIGNGETARVEMPRAGPKLGQCDSIIFGDQKHAEWYQLYRREVDGRKQIQGYGMVLDKDTELPQTIKIGVPSTDYVTHYSAPEEHIVGFFGASNDYGLTQLGLILQDTTCTEQRALVAYRDNDFKVNNGGSPIDEESSGDAVLLIVIIIVVVVIVIIIVIIVVVVLRKRKNQNVSKVNYINQVSEKQTAKSQASLADDDEDIQDQETKRSAGGKDSERIHISSK